MHRSSLTVGLILLVLGGWFFSALAGCQNTPASAPPRAFDRPDAVAFFCWDLTQDQPAPLTSCAPAPLVAGAEDLAEPEDGFALHALVTQTTTGEVAAVRLTGTNGEPGAIDSDVRVPGFTFIAVGDVPSGVVVSPTAPKHVFVVSQGSAQVHAVDIAAFRQGLGSEVTVYDELLPAGARPSDVLLSADGTQLIVALPTFGQLAFIDIEPESGRLSPAAAPSCQRDLTDDGVDNPTEVMGCLDLMTDGPAPVDLRALPVEALPSAPVYGCQLDPMPDAPPLVAPREPTALGERARPWQMLFDEVSGEILVADRARPLIHRIDPVAGTELAPLAVSVPTRELTITPRVPRSYATDDPAAIEPTERYLYAIDETDRTVLAVDVSDPDSARFGAVLPANVSAPVDRLAAPLPARAVQVVTPTYDAAALTFCTDSEQGALASGVNLHGVFLSVGTVDGRVRFFDVYDLDVTCRGSTCAQGTNPNPEDDIVAIGRHRPRIGAVVSEPVQLSPDPIWTATATSATVGNDGQTEQTGLVPGLEAVACEGALGQVFPALGSGDARVCAVTDPWGATNQTYAVTWNAAIPNTGSTGANLSVVDGENRIETRSFYCNLGALGSEDVPSEGALSAYTGDVVAITSDLPPSVLDGDPDELAFCESLTQRTVAGTTTPVLLPVLSAEEPAEGDIADSYNGRLVVGDPIVPETGFTFADVQRCFPELLEIELRVRDAFVVHATRAGFRSPVVRADDGRCVVDTAREAAGQRGRAFCGAPFSTPEIAFALGACETIDDAAALEMTVSAVPVPLTIDVSSVGGSAQASLLESLVYNEVDERLYAVDQSVQGLLRIRLTSLNVQQTFR